MRNAGLEEAQAGIRIAQRNINHLRYADNTTLMAESEEELKSLLMKVKEESEKVGRSEEHTSELQYSCLGNPMDRGALRAIVHAVAKSLT